MAKKTKPASIADDEIDPNAMYWITLSRPVKVGPTWMRPSADKKRALGSVVIEMGDAVASHRKVD